MKNYVMVAGGSGITPIYSMIHQLLHVEPTRKITLLYANSNEESIIFKEELLSMAKQFPQFSYSTFVSSKNRIGKDDLVATPDTQYYICGPDTLKEGIAKHLNALHIDPMNIHVEHFADGYTPWFGLMSSKISVQP